MILEELRREYSRYKVSLEVDFRTLVGWKKLGDQLTHQLHPYPAKLLPQIAAFFLQASVLTKGRSVLDPFCGSGTVALEASISGLAPFVADANPLALLLTTVKTTPYAIDDLLHEAAGILSRGKRYRTAPEVPIVNADIWYSDSTKRNLERLLRAIRDIEDTSVRSFFEVCFSVAARRLSYADPAISVPVRQRCKSSLGGPTNARIAARLQWLENADEFEEFASVCLINIERVLHTNASNPNRVAATPVGTDARQLGPRPDAPDTEYSLVLTSPPYGSAQKYVRASSLTLNWLGLASPSELSRLEAKSIGREHLPAHAPESTARLPVKFERLLHTISKRDARRAKITRTYLAELSCSLQEIARVTESGGSAIFVVGNNSVTGEVLETDAFIIQELQELGFTLELFLTDRIKSRGLLTKRSGSKSVIARESILLFKK